MAVAYCADDWEAKWDPWSCGSTCVDLLHPGFNYGLNDLIFYIFYEFITEVLCHVSNNFFDYEQRWLWDGISHPTKKIPIPGYGNPGDFALKSWDPHPGIFENIPGFPGIPENPKFSEKFFFTLKIKKMKKNIFSRENFFNGIVYHNCSIKSNMNLTFSVLY